MIDTTTDGSDDLPAGVFSVWLNEMRGALRGERPSDVPCGTCTACCTSSQFIHVAPDETDTLARIPAPLLFPAPLMPDGHVLMGYNAQGHCPMLIDDKCSIYDDRPRTCRTYDCRIFPAAGLDVDEPEKNRIARQATRWRFDHPTQRDRDQHEAVRRAAAFLTDNPDAVSHPAARSNVTQRAVSAIEEYESFMYTTEHPDPA